MAWNNFHYVENQGEITGKSFREQTEQAINDIAEYSETALEVGIGEAAEKAGIAAAEVATEQVKKVAVTTEPQTLSEERQQQARANIGLATFVRSFNGANGDVVGVSSVNGKTGAVEVGGGVAIGAIFAAPFTPDWTPEGAVLADGTEYRGGQFVELWNNFLVSKPRKLMTCTYEEFQADVAKTGSCAKFAIDLERRVFKVPLISAGTFVESGDGTAYEAGLPNVTGKLPNGLVHLMSHEGAFTLSEYQQTLSKSSQDPSLAWEAHRTAVTFDASRSSPVYGKSTTVQPKSVSMRYYVQVANGSINQSMMDWSQWATDLQGKANLALDNITGFPLEKINSKGKNWIRYESGLQICFVETETTQTFREASTGVYVTDLFNISFPVPFTRTPAVGLGRSADTCWLGSDRKYFGGEIACLRVYSYNRFFSGSSIPLSFIAIGLWK